MQLVGFHYALGSVYILSTLLFLYGALLAHVRLKRLINSPLHYMPSIMENNMWKKVVDFSSGCLPWDRWTNFLKYPGSYVNGNKLGEAYQASVEDCLQWCLSVERCRSADYYLSFKLCVIQDITTLDGYVSDWITGSTTVLIPSTTRWCAPGEQGRTLASLATPCTRRRPAALAVSDICNDVLIV